MTALSPRQLAVLRLIADGLTLSEIARELGVSKPTAKRHKESMFERLEVRSAPAAVAAAFRRGILTVESREAA